LFGAAEPAPSASATIATAGPPDTTKLLVPVARTDTTLLGAAEPAPSASATIATAGPPDTTKLMVPVAVTDTTLLGAAEPAPPASATIATAAPVLISVADKVSKDSQSAPAEPVSAQATANGANQGHAPVTSRDELAKPATVAPVPVAEQIQNQVSAHLDQLRQMGLVEVQVDLHPPELGRVQVHLAMEDGRVNVRMVVQDDAAKRVMDMQVEPLRVRFSEMGVSVGHFDVRRDGGSPNQDQQPASEPSAQAIQTDKSGPVRLRKPYGQVVNSLALVDVMA
jgi:flagellar hook-length control protein FliK